MKLECSNLVELSVQDNLPAQRYPNFIFYAIFQVVIWLKFERKMNLNSIKASDRSSSQRSIYDYPEHLNPFYEDENHKRLRFWKIGSDKSNRGSRTNSFSIDRLKGLWSFKTFKLKKKSSTLGINKTSESPPLLRRNDDRFGSQSTIDGRIRYTVDIGLGSHFHRGAPGRSSLQDLSLSRNQGENNFIRNNRYRSTMETNRSNPIITPLFRSRYNQPSTGSSQLSVNSNPFDDEYDTISEVGSPDRTSIRHSTRKKRRAPPPPLSPNKTAAVKESSLECFKSNETVNITKLTAEIESFVRIANTDKEIIKQQVPENEREIEKHGKVKTSRQSPECNEYYSQDGQMTEITIQKIQNLGETDINSNERCKRSPVKILVRAPTDEESISTIDEDLKLTAEVDHDYSTKDMNNVVVDSMCIEKTKKTEDNCSDEIKLKKETKFDSEKCEIEESVCNKENKKWNLREEITTPTSSAVEFILENNVTQIETELKITESIDDLTKVNESVARQVRKTNENESNKLEFLNENVALLKKPDSNFNRFEICSDSLEIRKKDDTKKEPPTPPQRRRSVKEIIESINKCQSLLKVNQDMNTNKFEKDNNDLSQASSSSKSYQNKMLTYIAEENNNAIENDMSNIPLFVEKFNEFNNNNSNDLFEKCVIRSDEKMSNVEWNPVPKPRRHRNSTQGLIN